MLKRPIYLDNAATSFPKPQRVYDNLRTYLERYGGCPGRGAYALAKQAEAVVEETRGLLAEMFHVQDPRRIVFALNATDALNMALKGALVSGDHVVTTAIEHNSVSRPLARMEREGLVRVTKVDVSAEGLVDPADIRRAMTDRTKLVAVVHGSNVTGALQPVADIGGIAREGGALFLVDAAQTAGAVPIDVESARVDLLAFPGHKALLGPPGTGGLYVGPRARLAPWREGGTGVFSEMPFQPEQMPHFLEAGSPNTLGLAGLRESVSFILQYGVDWVRSQELSLTERLLEGCRACKRILVYGPSALENRIAVVSVRIAGCSAAAVAEFLHRAHRIAVRAGLHCAPGAHRALGTFPDGTVRVSPGYFTTEEEVDACVAALHEAATRRMTATEVVG